MESKHRLKWTAGAAVVLAGSMILYEWPMTDTQLNEPLATAQRAESNLKTATWQAFFQPDQDCLIPSSAQQAHVCAAREQRARQRFDLSWGSRQGQGIAQTNPASTVTLKTSQRKDDAHR